MKAACTGPRNGAGCGLQADAHPRRYRQAQADDAWAKIFAFLDRPLK